MSALPPWLDSVFHSGARPYVSTLYPALGDAISVHLRTGSTAPVRRVFVRTAPDGEQAFTAMKPSSAPTPASANPHTTWWHAELTMREPTVHYRFIIEADDGLWWLTAAGPTDRDPLDTVDFRIIADYRAPSWLPQSVFYQIFPDRFAKNDPSTDPKPEDYEYKGDRPQTYAWGTPPDPAQPFPLVFYGGDLPGIQDKLAYLQDLGVTALYLNPIFRAYSNHKYDVADYEHVDEHFGGNQALVELARALHERGMRYLLDIVPNHCGYWHEWFARARAEVNAPEAEFFTFHDHPDEYESWLGVWSLPKLDYRSQALRQLMYADSSAVFRKWLNPPYDADGWRIDVANMLGRQGEVQLAIEIAHGIRRAVKETQSDAYLLGENFFDATAQLQGDQLDGVMNYMGFAHPLLYWLRGYEIDAWGMEGKIRAAAPWSTSALVATWRERQGVIPWQIAVQQFNLLGSHDTERIRSRLHEPADDEQTDADPTPDRALHHLAAVVQFTFPGVPCIYYGDELGMVDDAHLAQRACMNWDETQWDANTHDFYRRLIDIRKRSRALQMGSMQILAIEADTLAYQRETPPPYNGANGDSADDTASERIIVIAHRASLPRPAGPLPVAHGDIADGTAFVEYFTGIRITVENGTLPLPELAQGATLWCNA